MDLKEVLNKVEIIAKEVGAIIKERLDSTKDIKHKGRIDIVTEVDLLVEKKLKDDLSSLFPESNFLAEETANKGKLEDFTWIIDPLDGTVNYAHGIPIVAVCIALWKDKNIVLSVVYLPFTDEMFSSIKGQGAYLNGKRISVSEEKNLQNSLIATGFPYDVYKRPDEVLSKLKSVLVNVQGVRRMGSAAVDLVYVACGKFEGFFEMGLKPWDTAAGWLIVEEAGGKVTQFDNSTYNIFAPTILATNGFIHDELSKLLA